MRHIGRPSWRSTALHRRHTHIDAAAPQRDTASGTGIKFCGQDSVRTWQQSDDCNGSIVARRSVLVSPTIGFVFRHHVIHGVHLVHESPQSPVLVDAQHGGCPAASASNELSLGDIHRDRLQSGTARRPSSRTSTLKPMPRGR